MPAFKTTRLTLIVVAPDGTRHQIAGPFEAICAHELVTSVEGKFLPRGARPFCLIRGGALVAAYNPFRALGEYGLRDGDVLKTALDEGQFIGEPCFLMSYRVMQSALERYEAIALAGAALHAHLPAVLS